MTELPRAPNSIRTKNRLADPLMSSGISYVYSETRSGPYPTRDYYTRGAMLFYVSFGILLPANTSSWQKAPMEWSIDYSWDYLLCVLHLHRPTKLKVPSPQWHKLTRISLVSLKEGCCGSIGWFLQDRQVGAQAHQPSRLGLTRAAACHSSCAVPHIAHCGV